MEITNKKSLIGREEFYFAKLRSKTQETQIQEALEFDCIRLHNGGGLYMQKLQNYISCLSRIIIGASKKQVQFSRSVLPNSLQPMDFSTPGFPDLHQFPELAQTHVH